MNIYFLGYAGLFGITEIVRENEKKLGTHFSQFLIENTLSLYESFNVKKEELANLSFKKIYDFGDKGVYDLLWEIGEDLDCGLDIFLDKIPLKQEIVEISEYLDINPYKISSKGAFIAVSDVEIDDDLHSSIISQIGCCKDSKGRVVHYDNNTMYLVPNKNKDGDRDGKKKHSSIH